ncbi:MAG: hypothetical protein JO325_15285 [Solirubrobacterales bacterium]|nr:hypothetical protein [Solirubrobacterales bacterium]
MTLGGVNPRDIVLADVKGRRFYAIVIARRERVLEVEPIDRRVSYHRLKARSSASGERAAAERRETSRR